HVRLRGRGRPHPPAVSHHPARVERLVGLVGPALRPQLLLEPALRLPDPLRARAGDRPLLARPSLIKRTLRLTQPLLPALAGRDLRRKLVAARLAVELILGPVGRDRLLDDLPCDPLVIKRRGARGDARVY